MKILFLGYTDSELIPFLKDKGHEVFACTSRIIEEEVIQNNYDFLISYGYRFIIREDILKHFKKEQAINLHISYLPWNRGADPHFWSIVDGTPKGVTIHCIDRSIDTGDILLQKKVSMDTHMSLKQSYDLLHKEICELLKQNIESILSGRITPKPQSGSGTVHKSKDKERLFCLLSRGWDSTIQELIDLSREKVLDD